MKTTIRQRAYILSQIISEKIWGGEHGWEYANEGQFQSLETQAKLLVRSDLYEVSQDRIKDLEAENSMLKIALEDRESLLSANQTLTDINDKSNEDRIKDLESQLATIERNSSNWWRL